VNLRRPHELNVTNRSAKRVFTRIASRNIPLANKINMRLMLNRNATSRLRLDPLNINNRPRPRKRNRMFTRANRPHKLSRKSRNNLPIHRSKPDTLPIAVSLAVERSLTSRESRHQPKRDRQLENIIRELIIKQGNLNLAILRNITIGIHKPLQKRPTLLA